MMPMLKVRIFSVVVYHIAHMGHMVFEDKKLIFCAGYVVDLSKSRTIPFMAKKPKKCTTAIASSA